MGNVIFTNVYFDNALLTTVWAKGQHLRGMSAYLTTSVYMPTAASKIIFMQYMNIHMNYLESSFGRIRPPLQSEEESVQLLL